MIKVEKSQSCLKAGQNALTSHDYKAAHSIAMKRLYEDNTDPAPYYLLANIALEHGNTSKAEELFERAATLGKENSLYVSSFAKVLSLRGNIDQARIENEKAAALPVTNAHVADSIGVVFSRTGFHDKAISFYEKAISLDPRPDNFHYNKAASLMFMGNFPAAKEAYEAAITRNPENVKAYSSIVMLEKQSGEENKLKDLYALFERQKDCPDSLLQIGHAIAKTLEDLGKYEESLDWLHKAKHRKHQELNYNLNKYFDIFEAARKSFEKTVPLDNTSKESPIFIVGLPRTGTTLVDRIISSHPEVTSCGELNFIARLIKDATGTQSRLVMDDKTLQAAAEVKLEKLGRIYWDNAKPLRRNKSRMTDKMPLNFFYLGLIHRIFPKAKIVCLRRNAMDSCLSNYRQLFSTSYSYYNYTLSLDDTAQYYRRFDSLMNYWADNIPEENFMQIEYENIVFDQENQTRALLEFCDLSWNEACMRFHENEAPVSTASSVQVRQPLYSGSIGRWKRYGDKLDVLRSALGDLVT